MEAMEGVWSAGALPGRPWWRAWGSPVHYDAGVVIRAPRAAAIRKNATVATLCPHAAPVGPGCGRLHPLLGIHATPLTTSTEEHDGSSYVHHRGRRISCRRRLLASRHVAAVRGHTHQ